MYRRRCAPANRPRPAAVELGHRQSRRRRLAANRSDPARRDRPPDPLPPAGQPGGVRPRGPPGRRGRPRRDWATGRAAAAGWPPPGRTRHGGTGPGAAAAGWPPPDGPAPEGLGQARRALPPTGRTRHGGTGHRPSRSRRLANPAASGREARQPDGAAPGGTGPPAEPQPPAGRQPDGPAPEGLGHLEGGSSAAGPGLPLCRRPTYPIGLAGTPALLRASASKASFPPAPWSSSE